MSTDYFLYSKKHNRAVMVGSVGLGGVKSWPTEYGGREFIRWAIDNSVDDVQMVPEHYFDLEDIDETILRIGKDGKAYWANPDGSSEPID